MTDFTLIQKIVNERATPEEIETFREEFMSMPQAEYEVFITEYLDMVSGMPIDNIEKWRDRESLDLLLRKLNSTEGLTAEELPGAHRLASQAEVRGISVDRSRNLNWIKYAAAIIIMFGIGAYLYTTQKSTPVPVENSIVQDVPAPTTNRATITLANGQQIFLDGAGHGVLAREGKTNIEKTEEGNIIYKGKRDNEEMQYNMLFNPRGSRVVNLTLADGTKVWLNAESSLKYPIAFANDQRKVEVRGEAYFQVAKDKRHPFVVHTRSDDIMVLGTEFNVNSYTDEEFVRTTLVSGSVKLQNKVLQPGQAYVNGEVVKDNIEQTIAWKNGIFSFDHTALEQVMKQLGRWYDIEVNYEGEIPKVNYVGKAQRSLSLKDVLEVLSGMGAEFVIKDNRRLVVTKSR